MGALFLLRMPKKSSRRPSDPERFGALSTSPSCFQKIDGMEQYICRFEARCAQVRAELAECLEGYRSEGLKRAVLSPFDLVAQNSTQPNRNVLRAKEGKTSSVPPLPPPHFHYDVPQVFRRNLIASYTPATRTIDMGQGMDPGVRPMDMLYAIHEVRHVEQDNDVRTQWRNNPQAMQNYKNFLNGKGVLDGGKKIIQTNEVGTYALELRLNHLIFKHRLSLMKGMLADNSAVRQYLQYEQILDRFPAFREDTDEIPPAFISWLRTMMSENGYDIYDYTDNGVEIVYRRLENR